MILIIDGPHDKAVEFAQTLRGAHISKGSGALLLLEPEPKNKKGHELKYQLEKIVANGRSLPEDAKVDDVKWKPNSLILVPKKQESLLKDIEELVPGFTKEFGPIQRMNPL